jgi:hypothetical protein
MPGSVIRPSQGDYIYEMCRVIKSLDPKSYDINRFYNDLVFLCQADIDLLKKSSPNLFNTIVKSLTGEFNFERDFVEVVETQAGKNYDSLRA